ncbi:MAG: hypothetical protein J2P37_35075 [Ktedonobacteraceae bacterium]|nr:hypothetical protein [Ktedonobacteraceae bacterium]
MRLLDRLEEQQQHFPRSLAFEQDIHTFTFAHGVIEGRSWGQMFGAAGKPLDRVLIRMLLRSALALCETLRALHRNRCAHRALSPDDILYLDNQRTLLRDVGLATWRYKPGEGADGYRAPEQDIANGGLSLPGSHTDVYQLGMVLYHFITGHLPASTKQIVEPSAWNKELMPEIDAVLLRALALRIKERPTIADFSAALRRALR